jgi:hypothetical protein
MRKWSSVLIDLILLMFERMAYLEFLGAEYTGFAPMSMDEEWEDSKYE